MDASKFLTSAPGELRRIQVPHKDHAFIPHPLPAKWTFESRLWPLLVSAKEALGTLNGIGQTLPDQSLLLHPLQNREAIASSSIEGTFVTPEQLLLYELDPREPKSADEQAADWREVHNYGLALRLGINMLEKLPVCNRVILEMHKILMSGVRGRNKAPGEFRKWQVQIGSSGRYIPPPATEVESLMVNLERYINDDKDDLDPLIKAFIVHYQFEAIHPFGDGNGRVGRALMALMIYQYHGHVKPWLYLSAFFERFKDEYVQNMFNVSTEGNWGPWVEFCLRATIAQANDSIRRCTKFKQLQATFHERVSAPSTRTHKLIEELFRSPVLSIAAVQKLFSVTYHTAHADILRLVDSGILVLMPDTYPKSYYCRELIRVAYLELEQGDDTGREEEPSV